MHDRWVGEGDVDDDENERKREIQVQEESQKRNWVATDLNEHLDEIAHTLVHLRNVQHLEKACQDQSTV